MKPLRIEAGPHVIEWANRVKSLGIRSVICLMHSKELRYYDDLTGMAEGLLALYSRNDFAVCSIEWPDPAHAATPEVRQALRERVTEIRVQANEAFERLPKPVLLHCSAGIDRSTPVAAYIISRQRRSAA